MDNATSNGSSTNHLDSDHSKPNVTVDHVFTDEQVAACRPANTSATTQRQCIERALRIAPCHTLFFREVLGICAPTPRIFELRHDLGINVITRYVTVTDATGTEHKRVALYSIHSGTWSRYEP
jgi:hypothetical protein